MLLQATRFSPNSVSTLWGSYRRFGSGVLRGVLPQPRFSTAQARTEFRLRRQCRTDWWARDFGSFYRVSVHFLKQNVVLRDRRRRSDDRMVLEGRNVSLRGRCKESDTL